MYVLFIDTTDRNKVEIKLVKREKGKDLEVARKFGNADVVKSIKEILNESGLNVGDVKLYVPNTGPGSFTGLKIGVTVANILNWALGRKKLQELDYPKYGAEPHITPRKKP